MKFSLFAAFCGFACPSSTAGGEWKFFFPSQDIELKDLPFEDKNWRDIQVPGINPFLQTRTESTGWYRCNVSLPEAVTGRRLRLWLGRIVDIDWTYWNGELIGSHTAPETGWRFQRVYDVPAGSVKAGESILLVRNKRFLSTPGIVDKPYVGVELVDNSTPSDKPSDSDLEAGIDKIDDSSIPFLKGVSLHRKLTFKTLMTPKAECSLFRWRNHYDIFEIRVNGKVVGAGGCLEPLPIAALRGELEFSVPRSALKKDPKEWNTLEIFGDDFVEDSVQVSTKGTPDSVWELLDLPGIEVSPWLASGIIPDQEAHVIRELLNAGKVKEAEDRLSRARQYGVLFRGNDLFAELQARLSGQKGNEAALLDSIQQMWHKQWQTTLTTSMIEDIVKIQLSRGKLSEDALFLGEDRETRGNWTTRYGRGVYLLCGMNYNVDFGGGPVWPLKYSFSTANADLPVMGYISSSTDKLDGALINPATRSRVYAWRDDYGESNNFENLGPDLVLDVVLPAGDWITSLYIVDPDWAGTEHPRNLSILVLDERKKILAAARATNLMSGVYYRFALRGGRRITFRLFKHHSPDANLSGLFLDPIPRQIPPPVIEWAGAGVQEDDWATLQATILKPHPALPSDPPPGQGADDPAVFWRSWNQARTRFEPPPKEYRCLMKAFDRQGSRDGLERFQRWFETIEPDLTGVEHLGLLRAAAENATDEYKPLYRQRLVRSFLRHFQDSEALALMQSLTVDGADTEDLWLQAIINLSQNRITESSSLLRHILEAPNSGGGRDREYIQALARCLLDSIIFAPTQPQP